jgi:4-amino-4-deoxy-L-arabinose transferase-like glycosyltransferase
LQFSEEGDINSKEISKRGFMAKKYFFPIAILLFALLLVFKSSAYPKLWSDEGTVIELPLNLSKDGVYAKKYIDGYRGVAYDNLTIGPSVVLPLALGFKLLGPNIYVARGVIALFSISLLFALFRFVKRLFDETTAKWSVLVFSFSPYGLYFSRQVLGEIPCLFFLTAGLIYYHRFEVSKLMRELWLSLLFFNLAIVSKPQMLILIGVMGVESLIQLIRVFKRKPANLVLLFSPLLILVFSLIFQLWKIQIGGWDFYIEKLNFMIHLTQVETGGMQHKFLDNIFKYSWVKTNPLFWISLLLIPLYVIRNWTRVKTSSSMRFLLIFITVWLVYYMRSLGGIRLLLPFLLGGSIFIAYYLSAIVEQIRGKFRFVSNQLLVWLGLFVLVAGNLLIIDRRASADGAEVRNYIMNSIPTGQIIHYPKNELRILTGRIFQHKVSWEPDNLPSWVITSAYPYQSIIPDRLQELYELRWGSTGAMNYQAYQLSNPNSSD